MSPAETVTLGLGQDCGRAQGDVFGIQLFHQSPCKEVGGIQPIEDQAVADPGTDGRNQSVPIENAHSVRLGAVCRTLDFVLQFSEALSNDDFRHVGDDVPSNLLQPVGGQFDDPMSDAVDVGVAELSPRSLDDSLGLAVLLRHDLGFGFHF